MARVGQCPPSACGVGSSCSTAPDPVVHCDPPEPSMNESDIGARPSLRVVPPLESGASSGGPTRLQVRPSSPDQPKLLSITHRDEGSVWVVELTGEADL